MQGGSVILVSIMRSTRGSRVDRPGSFHRDPGSGVADLGAAFPVTTISLYLKQCFPSFEPSPNPLQRSRMVCPNRVYALRTTVVGRASNLRCARTSPSAEQTNSESLVFGLKKSVRDRLHPRHASCGEGDPGMGIYAYADICIYA